jgi:hypothetical protein
MANSWFPWFMTTKGYVSVYSVIPLISRPWSPLASQQWQLGQAEKMIPSGNEKHLEKHQFEKP